MSSNQDQTIRDLYYKVQSKKEEVKVISAKPKWVTNCAFRYEQGLGEVINIQTVTNVDTLVHIAGWLVYQEDVFTRGLNVLDLPPREYRWLGYTVQEWVTDIGTRIDKVSLVEKKKELDRLESMLSEILPPEFEKELRLEAILQSDALK